MSLLQRGATVPRLDTKRWPSALKDAMEGVRSITLSDGLAKDVGVDHSALEAKPSQGSYVIVPDSSNCGAPASGGPCAYCGTANILHSGGQLEAVTLQP